MAPRKIQLNPSAFLYKAQLKEANERIKQLEFHNKSMRTYCDRAFDEQSRYEARHQTVIEALAAALTTAAKERNHFEGRQEKAKP
jgi:hypothetical protein